MKVCIVSYFFPPNNSSGAQRWSKLVKCLHRMGNDVCVLANVGDRFGGEDPARALEMRKFARIYRLFWHIPHRPPTLSESRLKSILKFFVQPDSRLPFFLFHLKRMLRILRRERPHVLIATAPPFSALIAGRILSGKTGIPFVADLRDPWLNDPHRPNRLAKYLLERWVLKGAEAVLVINDGETYEEAVRFNRNVVVLEHTYDPDDYTLPPVPHPGEVWVSYLGSLYSSVQRRIIGQLPHLLPEGFRLRVFGPGTGRLLNRREAFREMLSSDVLLVLDLAARRKKLGSSIKFYDYLGTGKPIVVVSENPFLLRRAESLGLLTVPPTPTAVAKTIVKAHLEGRSPNRKRYEYRLDVACCKLVRTLYRAVSTRSSGGPSGLRP